MTLAEEAELKARRRRQAHRRTLQPEHHRQRPRVSMRQRIRYRFDNSLARGPMVLIGWLGCGV
ncbi:MAG: hypothetical protein M3137_12525, partial [Actinomycetota bacterium]|nr:hypothetical protein [Actinomycetota bacterium]